MRTEPVGSVEPGLESLRYPGHGGDPVDALLAAPSDSEERPAVVLIHEIFGLDAHMKALARRFARAGFRVLVPDLYSRAGLPGPAESAADPAPNWTPETIRAAVASLPDRQALADLDAAAALLGRRADVDGASIAAVGFCMGGTLAFLSGCTSTRFAAIVDFYGRPLYPELSGEKPIQPLELALNLDRPLLAFFGGRDTHVPPDDVERLREVLTAGAKNFEVVTYPEAGHGFFNDLRPGHHEASARDAWERTLTFLRGVLQVPPTPCHPNP